jgi:hypothetical protein
MAANSEANAPTAISKLTLTVTRGVTAGCWAGIPQVLIAQLVGTALGIRGRADIGPRFVARAAQHSGSSLSRPMHWLLAAVFHFEYAGGWGAAYALMVERLGTQRVPPLLSGGLLAALIYTAAFSRIGAATQTGAERAPEQRQGEERFVHWSAALTFGLTIAYTYRWLRERW